MNADYIYTHDHAYNFLVQYFLQELSDPIFRQDAAHEIEQDERMAYCRHMAAWLPYEPHYEEILKNLTTNEEGAIGTLFVYAYVVVLLSIIKSYPYMRLDKLLMRE